MGTAATTLTNMNAMRNLWSPTMTQVVGGVRHVVLAEQQNGRMWLMDVGSDGSVLEGVTLQVGGVASPPVHGRNATVPQLGVPHLNMNNVRWLASADLATATGVDVTANQGMMMAMTDTGGASQPARVITTAGLYEVDAVGTVSPIMETPTPTRGTTAAQSGVARSCKQPEFSMVNAPEGTLFQSGPFADVVSASMTETSPPGAPGRPLVPPVILHEGSNTHVAYVRVEGATGKLNVLHYDGTITLQPQSVDVVLPVASMAVARLMNGGMPQWAVVVPQGNGSLKVVFLSVPQEAEIVVNSSAELGGVVALRFGGETTDTLLVGDSDGLLHAVTQNGERTGGWPVNLGGRLYQAPLVAEVSGDTLLDVVVVRDVGNVNKVSVLTLGPDSAASTARTWPQFQHDPLSSGCLLVLSAGGP